MTPEAKAQGARRYSRAVVQKAYRGREPSAQMDASSLLAVLDLLEAEGIAVWLDGGWGATLSWNIRPASTTTSTSWWN